MPRFVSLGLLLAALSAPPAFSQADAGSANGAPAIAFLPVVADAIDRVILPGYQRLAEAARREAVAASDLCWQADAQRLEAARTAFADVVHAWSWVEMFRFGPVREDNRYERLFFWPDPRGRGLKQVQVILADEDPAATAPASLRDKSVAVQGLFALEYVLFGAGSEALAEPGTAGYRCRYGAAVAEAIAITAGEIDRAWQDGAGYSALMHGANAENPVYRSHGEVVQDLLKSCREQVQLAQQLKLAFTVGATPDEAKARLAPFWRSNLTLASIRANISAVLALCGADGLGTALPGDSAWRAESLASELAHADQVLSELEESGSDWAAIVADPVDREKLKFSEVPLGGAAELLEHGYPDAFGLITGFNSLDGD